VADIPAEGPILLQAEAERDWYHFSWAPAGGQLTRLASGETRYLSTEVAGGFTGVYAAMYATGNGQPSMTPADFDWFELEPTDAE
jgi:alpha-N-arabinofuranosidase